MDESKQLNLDKNYYSVVHNDIIKGKQRMTLREAQLLHIAISQVLQQDDEFSAYTTTAIKLARFLGVSKQNLYRDLDKITDQLMSRIIKCKVNGEYTKFQWVKKCKYNPDTKVITIELHDDLKPYLLHLKRFYTQTQIETILTFKSYYAFRLYQLIVCECGEKKSKEAEFNLSIEDIRDFFQTGDKYKQNRDLIKKTIKPALAELNASDYCLILDEAEIHLHTKGSPIQGIKFRAIVCDDKNDKAARLKAERLRLALEVNNYENS